VQAFIAITVYNFGKCTLADKGASRLKMYFSLLIHIVVILFW